MPMSPSRICAATATITRPRSFRRASSARPGCSSIKWSTRPSRAGWANSSTRWRCRPQRRRHNDFRERKRTMTNNPVIQRIQQDITDNEVVLYMKGTPVFPQCGFSAAVVQVLSELGVKFKGIDVLTDPSLRRGIKEFSSWPTIPQLYVKGVFIGVCEIVGAKNRSGEMREAFHDR